MGRQCKAASQEVEGNMLERCKIQETRKKEREESEDLMSVANVSLLCFSKLAFLLRRKACQMMIQESPISIFRSDAHTNQLHRTQIMLMCWFRKRVVSYLGVQGGRKKDHQWSDVDFRGVARCFAGYILCGEIGRGKAPTIRASQKAHQPLLASVRGSYFSTVDLIHHINQCPGRFLDIVGRDPTVSNINRLHIDVFRFFQLLS